MNLSVVGAGPLFTDQLVLIDNVDASSTVTGTFDGLLEGSTVSVGSFNGRITYMGGTDNNDVVLTVLPYTPVIDGFQEGRSSNSAAPRSVRPTTTSPSGWTRKAST